MTTRLCDRCDSKYKANAGHGRDECDKILSGALPKTMAGRDRVAKAEASVRRSVEHAARARTFVVGDHVGLRDDVLLRHARSVPAHAGYTREQFEWRKTLSDLRGKRGEVERTFPDSRHVNVRFGTHLIGINREELVPWDAASGGGGARGRRGSASARR